MYLTFIVNDKEQRLLQYIPENVRVYMREPTGIYA